MTLKIYTIYDAKSMTYETPICWRARGEAIRWYQDLINDPKSKLYHHPEDYDLFELGDYDQLKATLTPYKSSVPLGKATEFKKEPNATQISNESHIQ